MLERITKRRVCVTCGHIYSVDDPPKNGWICDVDGGEVVQRDDDTEEAVRKRLDLYAAETLPLVGFYTERGLLVEVDGLGSPDEVFARLLAAVAAPVDRADRRRAVLPDAAPSAPPTRSPSCGGPAGWWPRCTSEIRAAIRPGVTTGELDRIGREVLADRGATSNFLGYASPPFPA